MPRLPQAAAYPGRARTAARYASRASLWRCLERAGVSRSVAMKLVGHKTESVYRRYAIVAESDLREAGAKLSALGDNQGGIRVTAREGRHPNP